MKKIVLFFCIIIVFSCGETQTTYKPLSSGRIHSLSVVIDSKEWNSKIGDAIREAYADEYLGLPQIEERFSLSHIDYETFSGFARTSRNIIYINKRKSPSYEIIKNKYARPQVFIEISGTNEEEIISQIEASRQKGIISFSRSEIIENQRRILQSPLTENDLKKDYSIDLTMSSAYQVFKKENNVIWYQKPTKYGTSNIIISELNLVDKIELTNSIQIRDSISKNFVPGRVEGSYMISEKAYSPVFTKTRINNFESFETRGTWEVKGDFMGGPFINYLIKDNLNNRILYLEGFVFSPSQRKRDNIIELEAIVKSLKIYKRN
jgi:nitrous oxide reductase